MKFYIYFHTRLDTNQVFYVGKGAIKKINSYRRAFENHNRSNWWKNITNKSSYRVDIMMSNLDENEAFYWEKFYIKYIGRVNKNKGPLVNLTDGGEGKSGHVVSLETIEKIKTFMRSRVISEETRSKLSNFKISPDHRTKLNDSRKGIKLSESHCQNIANGHMGLTASFTARKNMSDSANKIQVETECPNCGKIGKGNSMKRWHFENCKKICV